jgi:transposase
MSNTKTAKTLAEKIASKDEKIQQLLNDKKQLIQRQKTSERKERTSRLCRRHGLLEKFIPDLITITDEQFEAFVRTHINTNNGRNRLVEIIDKGAEAAAVYILNSAQVYSIQKFIAVNIYLMMKLLLVKTN